MTDTIIPLPGHRAPKPVAEKPAELPLTEPAMAAEIFTAELARIYVHGPFSRLVWATPDVLCDYDTATPAQRVVNAKLIVPTEALPAIYEALGKAIAATEGAPS